MSVARRIFRLLAIAACFGVVLADSVHGGNKMDSTYLYEEKEYQTRTVSLPPQTFKISGGLFGSYRNVSLFPVPFDNAVGSNDIGNAITIISFPKGKIDYDRYFRNAADDMSGGGEFVFLSIVGMTPGILSACIIMWFLLGNMFKTGNKHK